MSQIAMITRLEFFTSEIALIKSAANTKKFVAIDYVNDQPDLCVRPDVINGPLPEIVRYVAQRCVDTAFRMIHGWPVSYFRSVMLAKLKTIDETI